MIITTAVITRCSAIIGSGFFLNLFAILSLTTVRMRKPQIMLMITAVDNEKRRTGIANVSERKNFVKKVYFVEVHMCFFGLFSDSSEMWIPIASERASAMAIVKIPPRTASFECVLEFKPTINPRVVITAEVSPKFIPLFLARIILWCQPISISWEHGCFFYVVKVTDYLS